MNKVFLCCASLWGLWPLVLSGQETALPFRAGTFTPEQMTSTIAHDVRGTWAVLLQPDGNGSRPVFYRSDGSSWLFAHEPSLGFHAGTEVSGIVFNESLNEVVAFGENRVFFFSPNLFTPSADDWVASHPSRSIIFEEDEEVVQVRVDGTTAAVVWKLNGLNEIHYLTIYERDGATFWREKATRTIDGTGPFGPQPARLSSLALRGDRVAIGASSEREIKIFERDEGGSSQWGRAGRLLSTDSQPVGGREIELVAGDILLDVVIVPEEASVSTRVMRFQENEGGSGQWGAQGPLVNIEGAKEVVLDTDGGQVLVASGDLEQNAFGSSLSWEREVKLEVLSRLSGGAWVNLGSKVLPGVRGELSLLATTTLNRVFTSSPPENYQGSGRWTVSIYTLGGFNFVQTLSDEGAANGIGNVIDFNNGLVAAGNPTDAWFGSSSGSVLLYEIQIGRGDKGQSLIPLTRLESPEPEASERFGASVSIQSRESRIVAVGAPGWGGNRGRVYVYLVPFTSLFSGESQPVLLATIDAPDADDDRFGHSVALLFRGGTDTTLAVGAPFDDEAGADAGAFYIYERNSGGTDNWGFSKKVARPSIFSRGRFGWRMVFLGQSEGDDLVVATSTEASGAQLGVFDRNELGSNNWGLEGFIDTPATASQDFGLSLGGGGQVFAVGSPYGNDDLGRAYIFGKVPIGWTITREEIGTATDGPSFGAHVSVSDFHFAVGSPDVNSASGRLTVFGGIYQDYADWPLLFTRDGSDAEVLGGGVASQAIYMAVTRDGEIDIERAGDYEIWAKSRGFSATDDWFPWGNADGDHHDNLLEFALGTDPRDAASEGGFELERGSFEGFGGPYPAMIWRRPNLPYSTFFLGSPPQVSTDLRQWFGQSFDSSFEDGARMDYYEINPSAKEAFYRLAPVYPVQFSNSLN